jgi:hypothetical protein
MALNGPRVSKAPGKPRGGALTIPATKFVIVRHCLGAYFPYNFRTSARIDRLNHRTVLVLVALPRGLEPLFSP